MIKDPTNNEELVHKVERVISNILRGGVILSLLLIVCGTAISFMHHADSMFTHGQTARMIDSKAEFPHSLKETLDGVRNDRGQAVVVVGLLVLIATPVVRVGVSIIAFVIEKDATFVVLTTIVFALLLLSFFLGKAGG